MMTIYLKRGKDESLRRFHPWIFSGAIHHVEGQQEEGALARVFTAEGAYIATGHWQIGSIAVRVLTFDDEAIDAAFWQRRLQAALEVRRAIGVADNPDNSTFRLVHGEGDHLPGLVIDVYGATAVVQAHSVGMHVCRQQVAEALDQLHCTRIVIAHRLSTIKNCDRILVLNQGRIQEQGTYDELIAKDGFFAELIKRQRLDV
jgi:23S rRNA (cytosine1962-C5)-methyltransferase